MVGGRWQEGVGRVEGADGEGGLDEGAPLSKLSFPQGIWVAWMSRGEKGGESIFAVRVEKGVSSSLCRPHRVQPLLALNHSLHVKALSECSFADIDVVLLLGGECKRVVGVGGVPWVPWRTKAWR